MPISMIIVAMLSGCEIEVNRSTEYEEPIEEDRKVRALRQPVAICSEETEFIDWQEGLLLENDFEPIRVSKNSQECLYLEKEQVESAKSIMGVAF